MRAKINRKVLAVALIATLLITQTAAAATRNYKTIDLGTLGGDRAYATDINDAGTIVGYGNALAGSEEYHAFVWKKGVMTDLGLTAGLGQSAASAINDRGQIVGHTINEAGEWRGFLLDKGTVTDLGVLSTPPGVPQFTTATDINKKGWIVGLSSVDWFQNHAFLWKDGVMTDLGTLGGPESNASAINDKGQIVGWSDTASGEKHAFLWQNGSMIDLGTLGSGSSSAYNINRRGQIVGVDLGGPEGQHGFLWENGVMTDLGPHYNTPLTVLINDRGRIVTSGSETILWWTSGLPILLRPIIGGLHLGASAINEDRVVGASGTPSGEVHAVLWRP